ncbi:hypothetical protein E4T56_gene3183 [Termitomyces sp. T112]|nr:hypothetical protein E4T56_gene3183 [Termitomyces sp. T112]
MPSITVDNNITFYYTDSGPPSKSAYVTIFFLHGLTFHSGIFQRLADSAWSRQLRIIAFNRREYPGSSPYTDDERRVIRTGSFEERLSFVQEQGKLIVLAVDGLIQQLSLPRRVAVAGWSLGTATLISMYCSIGRVSDDVQRRLRDSVKTFILLDTTIYCLGVPTPPGGYNPFFDRGLSAEQRTPAFQQWASSYYQHGDLSSHDISELRLSLSGCELLKRPTVQTMTPMEWESTASPNSRCDSLIASSFRSVLEAQTNTFLFDSQIRKLWGKHKFWCLYGEASMWASIYASWYLEKKSNEINFKSLYGSNHFFMWDYPEGTLDLLIDICTNNDGKNLEYPIPTRL